MGTEILSAAKDDKNALRMTSGKCWGKDGASPVPTVHEMPAQKLLDGVCRGRGDWAGASPAATFTKCLVTISESLTHSFF